MNRKVVVLLQGGGALGAFQCGAWKALHPFLRENNHELLAIAGASIGAINAGLIARHFHDDDGGTGILETFWREAVATAPAPFFPFPGEYWRSWNGLLTGLLLGNRSLFTPAYPHWNPLSDMFRFRMPFYDTQDTERTLARLFGEYRGADPLLLVGTTDVESGESLLFDSASRTITPRMLAASIAIPILFSPVEIDGRPHWDSEMRSHSLAPDVFDFLRNMLLHDDKLEHLLFIVIDMFRSDMERLPSSAIDAQYRLANILLGEKLRHEQREFDVANSWLDSLEHIRSLAEREPDSPLAAAIREEYQRAVESRRARVEFLHIGRMPFEYEHISRDFDYSPGYIARLITQGQDSASRALEAYAQGLRKHKRGTNVELPASSDLQFSN